MKQVTKSLLSLALLGALAGGVALFAWLRSDSTGGGAAEEPLVSLEVTRLIGFELAEQGGSLRVERTAAGWDVITPVRIAADPKEVETLLGGLSRLRPKERFSEKNPAPEPSATGLDAPQTVFEAWTADEPPRRLRVEIGSRSDFNHQEYARYTAPGAEPVVVMLSSGSRRSIVRTAEQLYDIRVLGAASEELVQVRIEPREESEDSVAFTLERTGVATFRCIDPFEGEVDSFVTRRVIEGLTGAPVSEMLTLDAGGQLEPYGLHEPAFTVTAWLRPSGAPDDAPLVERKILVSALPEDPNPETAFVHVARGDQPWVGTAHTLLWHSLRHGLDTLKTRRVTSVERADVHRMELDLVSGEHVILARDDDQQPWQVLAPEPGGRANPQLVAGLLLGVSSLVGDSRAHEGTDVQDATKLAALGVGEDARRVRLLGKGGEEPLAVIRVGKEDGDDIFVLREGGDFVARVPWVRLADLPLKAIEFLD